MNKFIIKIISKLSLIEQVKPYYVVCDHNFNLTISNSFIGVMPLKDCRKIVKILNYRGYIYFYNKLNYKIISENNKLKIELYKNIK